MRAHHYPLEQLTRFESSAAALSRQLEESSATHRLAKLMEENALSNDRYLKAIESITLQTSSAKQLEETFRKLEAQQQIATRLAAGPLEDLRRLAERSEIAINSAHSAKALARLEKQFRLPKLDELSKLAEAAFTKYESMTFATSAALEAAVARMNAPWLERAHELQSVQSFAALQTIGSAIERASAFEDTVSDLIRKNLGDWRDHITWPQTIFEDISARSAFYDGHGFDPALTNLPSDAFEESVEIARLDEAPPKLEIEDYQIPASDGPPGITSGVFTRAGSRRLPRRFMFSPSAR